MHSDQSDGPRNIFARPGILQLYLLLPFQKRFEIDRSSARKPKKVVNERCRLAGVQVAG